MSPEMQVAAQVAQLGIGTLMAFGMLGVVWYLLKVTIPSIQETHKNEIKEINEQNLKVLSVVVDESKRANDAICSRMERMENNFDKLRDAVQKT